MIPEQVVEEIFQKAIIEEVIGDFVPLKKRGVNYLGNCPFHDEKTASFTVSPTKSIYKCFGCGKAGNAVKFLMDIENLSYPEALKYLAKKYNIELQEKELTKEEVLKRTEKESLGVVIEFAKKHFMANLDLEEGKNIAMTYFLERDINKETINKFSLGYAINTKDYFSNEALSAGYNVAYLEKSGLTIIKDKNQNLDRFRGRVIFPIHSVLGKVVGFGGRIIGKHNTKIAKYINSPESEIYNKSQLLYGLFESKKAIVKEDKCYIVEGYIDVLAMHQLGIENVVASSGTALTKEQVIAIKRFTSNLTILFDSDPSGIKASFRGINIVLEQEMNVNAIPFPDGQDPDSFVRGKNKEQVLEYFQENEEDFIDYTVNTLSIKSEKDLLIKTKYLSQITESLACIQDTLKRQLYVQKLSKLVNISESILIEDTNKKIKSRLLNKNRFDKTNVDSQQSSFDTEKIEPPAENNDFLEREILRLILNYGNKEIEIETLDNESEKEYLSIFLVKELSADDIKFKNELYQQLLNQYKEQLLDNNIPDTSFFTNSQDTNIARLAVDLLSKKYVLSKNWETHNIHVKQEKDNLGKACLNTIYAYKLQCLEDKINSLIEKIESGKLATGVFNQLTNLHAVRKELKNILGR